jgi:hypothetical protein
MIVVAVDPGLTGACAVVDHNGLRALFDLPTMHDPIAGPEALVKNKVDGRALVKLLRQHCPAGEPVRAVLESVRTMGGKNNAVQTQGSLLRSLGAIETVLECMGWLPSYVAPQTWKRHYGLIKAKCEKQTAAQGKRKSLECARRLYPQCNELARAKDHNRSEALLMAHHWRQVNA